MSSAVIGLLILVMCIVLFVTEWLPPVATGALGCILMVLFKVCSLEQAFSGFASSIIYLLFGALVVGNAMFETGAANLIGKQVVKVSRNNERLFLLFSGLAAGILAMFLANTAVIAAFLPIIESVCSSSTTMKRKNLTLNVAICAMIGGASTLIGCTPQLTANGILKETTGLEFSMFTMFVPGVIMLAVYLISTQLFGYKLGLKLWGHHEEEALSLDDDKIKKSNQGVKDKKKVIIMFVIITFMIIFYITQWLSTAMTAMCAAMLCILTKCTDVPTIRKNIDWDTVIFLAFCLGLANALNAGGTGELIKDFVSPILGESTSPMIIYAILVLTTLIISNFITNSTAIIIVLPIGLSIASAMGLNPMTVCLGVYFAASLACSTPIAAAQITMTMVAKYRVNEYILYTLPHAVIMYACMLVFIPMCFPLV